MSVLVNGLLVLLAVSGFYITFSSSWSAVYRAVLLLHPALGLCAGFLFISYILSHYREKHQAHVTLCTVLLVFGGACFPLFLDSVSRRAFFPVAAAVLFLLLYLRFTLRVLRIPAPFHQRLAVLLGQVLLAVFFMLLSTGIFMTPGAAHNTRIIMWHRYAAFLFAAFFLLHVTRLAFVFKNYGVVFARMKRFILPALTGGVILLLFYQGKVSVKHVRVTVDIPRALEGKPPDVMKDISLMTVSRSCGARPACHQDIVKHYAHSNHFRSPESPHFKKIVALLARERGKQSARFCYACHAPQLAVAAYPENIHDGDAQKGISCITCHTLSEAHLVPFGKPEKKGAHEPKGYTVDLNMAHLSMFMNADARRNLSPLNAYLIKLNPLGHGRVFMSSFLKSDAFCLSCHQEHIPPKEKEDIIRPNCRDCHMQLQKSFVRSPLVKKAHYFAGANVITPRVLGDKESYSVIKSWLTGYFKTQALDSYWELRQAAGEPPQKATWLVMTMEPLNPPEPGKKCRVKIFTSNPGIGHPFPTGVIDLYDVWMNFRVSDEDGNTLYQNGKPAQKPFEKTDTHWLGGYFYDANGKPIIKHRIWEKKGAKRRWVEPGKTIEDIFTFAIPSSVKGSRYIVVEAQWNYGRLNHDFSFWAYGKNMDFPPVPMVSVKQRIPIEHGS